MNEEKTGEYTFLENEVVEIRQYDGKIRDFWIEGRIAKSDGKGLYDVQLENGWYERVLRHGLIRVVDTCAWNEEEDATARNKLLQVGDRVLARYFGKHKWFAGTIVGKEVKKIGRHGHEAAIFDVKYDDGDFEKGVGHGFVRALEGDLSCILPRTQEKAIVDPIRHINLKEGQKVLGKCGGTSWLVGYVSRVNFNGTVDIIYENQVYERSVLPENIQLLKSVFEDDDCNPGPFTWDGVLGDSAEQEKKEEETQEQKFLFVGQAVTAPYGHTIMRTKGNIYRINDDGTYDIVFQDGVIQFKVKSSVIQPMVETPAVRDVYVANQKVLVRNGQDYKCRPGRIVKPCFDGQYLVQFEDDKKPLEEQVSPFWIIPAPEEVPKEREFKTICCQKQPVPKEQESKTISCEKQAGPKEREFKTVCCEKQALKKDSEILSIGAYVKVARKGSVQYGEIVGIDVNKEYYQILLTNGQTKSFKSRYVILESNEPKRYEHEFVINQRIVFRPKKVGGVIRSINSSGTCNVDLDDGTHASQVIPDQLEEKLAESKFQVGTRVRTKRGRGSYWVQGKILKVHKDDANLYDILHDDGFREHGVHVQFMEPIFDEASTYKCGQFVDAKRDGWAIQRGRILRVHSATENSQSNEYDVRFDDGYVERRVLEENIASLGFQKPYERSVAPRRPIQAPCRPMEEEVSIEKQETTVRRSDFPANRDGDIMDLIASFKVNMNESELTDEQRTKLGSFMENLEVGLKSNQGNKTRTSVIPKEEKQVFPQSNMLPQSACLFSPNKIVPRRWESLVLSLFPRKYMDEFFPSVPLWVTVRFVDDAVQAATFTKIVDWDHDSVQHVPFMFRMDAKLMQNVSGHVAVRIGGESGPVVLSLPFSCSSVLELDNMVLDHEVSKPFPEKPHFIVSQRDSRLMSGLNAMFMQYGVPITWGSTSCLRDSDAAILILTRNSVSHRDIYPELELLRNDFGFENCHVLTLKEGASLASFDLYHELQVQIGGNRFHEFASSIVMDPTYKNNSNESVVRRAKLAMTLTTHIHQPKIPPLFLLVPANIGAMVDVEMSRGDFNTFHARLSNAAKKSKESTYNLVFLCQHEANKGPCSSVTSGGWVHAPLQVEIPSQKLEVLLPALYVSLKLLKLLYRARSSSSSSSLPSCSSLGGTPRFDAFPGLHELQEREALEFYEKFYFHDRNIGDSLSGNDKLLAIIDQAFIDAEKLPTTKTVDFLNVVNRVIYATRESLGAIRSMLGKDFEVSSQANLFHRTSKKGSNCSTWSCANHMS